MESTVHNAYLQGKILCSEPLTLVCLLYDAALGRVQAARQNLREGDIRARSEAISKASELIGLLTASLNLDQGKDLANHLLELYLYMQRRLLEANLKQSDSALAEVESLLTVLSQSWHQLAQGATES